MLNNPSSKTSINSYWIFDEIRLLNSNRIKSLGHELDLNFIPISIYQKFSELEISDIRVVVIEWTNQDYQTILNKTIEAKKLWPSSPCILFYDKNLSINSEQLIQLVNLAGIFSIISSSMNDLDLKSSIHQATIWMGEDSERIDLLANIKSQNKYLEELTTDQSKLIELRTSELEKSKTLVESKVNEIRLLTKFVRDLSNLVSVEEILELCRDEIRKFHKVGSPILAYQISKKSRKIYWSDSRLIRVRNTREMWPFENRIQFDNKNDSIYLANEFSRPFGQVLSIPIPPVRSHDDHFRGGVIYFEHSLNKKEREEFVRFEVGRIQPLAVALDRVFLEQELKDASRLWEDSFDGFNDPIAIVTNDFKLLRANQRFFVNEKGSSCFEYFNNRTTPCEDCPIFKFKNGIAVSNSNIRRGYDHFELHSYPVNSIDENKKIAYINHYVDLSSTQRLQAKVVQNEKMVAVGHLAGHIAHELNNPLTGIRSSSQVLLNDLRPSDTLYEDLLQIEKAAERCQKIIKNLVEFSRGSGQVKVSTVEFNDIVEKTIPLLKTALHPYNKDIELCEEPTWVNVEPQLIQQVIFNIINNACQAMGEKGSIQITTEIDLEEGQKFVVFRVKDSGPGIPDELQELVFAPFFTTKKNGQGTGLGLSMSKQIIESFGGQIYLLSKIDQGTEFVIKIPCFEST